MSSVHALFSMRSSVCHELALSRGSRSTVTSYHQRRDNAVADPGVIAHVDVGNELLGIVVARVLAEANRRPDS